nr:MAG TPA: hypothetical protein [Bacteriophage sp.]
MSSVFAKLFQDFLRLIRFACPDRAGRGLYPRGIVAGVVGGGE